jgi:hypothetical protein
MEHDYRVFAHFVDPGGTILFTDDHEPPVPTSDWVAGQDVVYKRALFGPRVLWDGPLAMEVGLYRPELNQKLGIGRHGDESRIGVGQLTLAPLETEHVFYGRGFYLAERAAKNQLWRWTEKTADATIVNPRKDSVLHLALSGEPGAHADPLQVRVLVNGDEVSRLEVSGKGPQTFSLPLSSDLLGNADSLSLGLEADKTFVPAEVGLGEDDRVLGVRVFHVCLEPGA